MQVIAPVTDAQLLQKGKEPLLKFEIYDGCCWVDLTAYVKANSLSISSAGAEMTPRPVAGKWGITLFNKNGRFDPDVDTYAPDNEYLRVGRRVKISIGSRFGGVDYYWRRIYGFMDLPKFSIDDCEVTLNGMDNMQFLTDTKLRKPNNYWGTTQTFSTVATVNTYSAEKYNEEDAMDTDEDGTGLYNNVTNWQVSPAPAPGPAIASVADGAAPGGTWVGEITLGSTPDNNRVLNDNILNGNVTAGRQYRVVFEYRNVAFGGTVDVNIYESGAGGGIMGGVTCPFSAAYVEISFFFTATKTGTIRMTIENFTEGFEFDTWRIDMISVMEVTGTSNTRYNMIAASQGAYYATLNGDPIWYGVKDEGWYYDYDNHIFYFDDNKQVEAGLDNLIVYYFTVQDAENVVADLLVIAGLYDNRAEALADMIHTPTGTTINQVWFDAGTTVTDAMRLICERCNYRFYFNYSGRPVFKPASTVSNLAVDGGLNVWIGANNLTHWTEDAAGGSTVNREAVEKVEGNFSCRLDIDAGNAIAQIRQTNVPLTASSRCKITFWYMNSLAGKTAGFSLRDVAANVYLREDGTWNVGAYTIVLPNSLVWTKYELEFYAHEDYSLYRILLGRDVATSSSIYYDDVIIWRTDFDFTESHITNIRDYEDRSEIRNRIVIKGRHQAQFVERRETMPSELDGETSEVASVNKYGEHTWEINNHLFQDQATINIYKAIYLVAFKDPKWYTTFETPYNPAPLVKGDVATWRKRYEVGGTPINQWGLIRDIQINEFIISYIIEKLI